MNSKKNSLESTVCKVAPKVKELIEKLPTENCIAKPRISGSGSVVYILFERKKDLIYYKEKLSFGKKITWCLSSYLRL